MSDRFFRLYWSHLEAYEACPRSFLWGHGWGKMDLGGGPGRRKPVPVQDSRHHAVMGLVIGSALEKLYNEELYRTPSTLREELEKAVRRELEFSLGKEYIDWSSSPSRAELLETCQNGIRGFLDTMRVNRLLGPYARSEVNLDAWIDDYTPISGRPDLIIRRDDTGVAIYDGKNSKNPAEHADPDQLRWYSLCFYLKYKVLPTRLAFVCFRYPPGKPPPKHSGPWDGLIPVELTREHLQDLGVRAKKVHLAMVAEKFDPTPSAEACRFCNYKTVCDAYKPPRRRQPKAPAPGSVEETVSSADGLVELGFR